MKYLKIMLLLLTFSNSIGYSMEQLTIEDSTIEDSDEVKLINFLLAKISDKEFDFLHDIENNNDRYNDLLKEIHEETAISKKTLQENSVQPLHRVSEPELPKNETHESQLHDDKIEFPKLKKQKHKNPKRRKITHSAISENNLSLHEVPQDIESLRQKNAAEEFADFAYKELKNASCLVTRPSLKIQLHR